MKDIKTGEYVRTRWGCIAKFEGIHEGFYEFDNIIMDESCAVRENLFVDIVEKTSPDIIDLIELGDLVRLFMEDNLDKEDTNIFEVIAITRDKKEIGVFTKDCELDFYPIENLRGIVTKEQFESMEYRIGE